MKSAIKYPQIKIFKRVCAQQTNAPASGLLSPRRSTTTCVVQQRVPTSVYTLIVLELSQTRAHCRLVTTHTAVMLSRLCRFKHSFSRSARTRGSGARCLTMRRRMNLHARTSDCGWLREGFPLGGRFLWNICQYPLQMSQLLTRHVILQ